MSAKAIREATGKGLLNRHLGPTANAAKCQFASVDETTDWGVLVANNPWLNADVSVFIFNG